MSLLPLVSVIVTNHNYAHFLGQAIASVASQTYPRLECVIVDDASTDGSQDVIEATLAELDDGRFRSVSHEVNRGQMAGFHTGLAHTRGPFVAFLDADDYWGTDFVARHVATHLNSAYAGGLSGSDVVVIDGEGMALMGTFHPQEKTRTPTPAAQFKPIAEHMVPWLDLDSATLTFPDNAEITFFPEPDVYWRWTATSAMMFRRSVIDFVFPASWAEIRICADYYLAVAAQLLSGSILIAQPLSYYRMHQRNAYARSQVLGGTNTANTRDWMDIYTHHRRLIRDHFLARKAECDVFMHGTRFADIIKALDHVLPSEQRTSSAWGLRRLIRRR